MADQSSIKLRNYRARERWEKNCPILATLVGIDPPSAELAVTADETFRSMQRLEAMADFSDRLVAALSKPKQKTLTAAPAR